MAPYGGEGAGFVYRFNEDGSDLTLVKSFLTKPRNPIGKLIDGNNGFYYGVSPKGGENDGYAIYRISSTDSSLTTIHKFAEGITCNNGLAIIDGLIYGTTQNGGQYNCGAIFKLKLDGTGYETIYSFAGASEQLPFGGLLAASDGDLYGTTWGSDNGWSGSIIFKFEPETASLSSLHYFNGPIAVYPNGDLIEGADGYLYGTTREFDGGDGSIFKISKSGGDFVYLKIFSDIDRYPTIGVIEGANDYLFGTVVRGGDYNSGAVYRIKEDGTGYEDIHSFTPEEATSSNSNFNLVYYKNYLYGTANIIDGPLQKGNLYKLNIDGSEFELLDSLGGNTGNGGWLSVIAQRLFYVSNYGGLNGFGIVGTVNEGAHSIDSFFEFQIAQGIRPRQKLLFHSNGYIYGTASEGGLYGYGTLFRIDPKTNTFSIQKDFSKQSPCCTGPLIEIENGDILGITGPVKSMADSSKIFEFNPLSKKITTYYTSRKSALEDIWESYTGAIYGTTAPYPQGSGSVSLFRLDSVYTTLTSLPGVALDWASSNPDTLNTMFGNSGNYIELYSQTTGELNVLHSFDGNLRQSDGYNPAGQLVEVGDNTLMGIATYGGANNSGAIYTVNTYASEFRKEFDFDCYQCYPVGGLVQGSNSYFGVIRKIIADSTDVIAYSYSQAHGYNEMLRLSNVAYHPDFPVGLTLVQENTPRIRLYGDLDFGEVYLDSAKTLELRVKNVGTVPLSIDKVESPKGYVAIFDEGVIKPGTEKVVDVRFMPAEDKSFNGLITVISSNASPQQIPVYGKGFLLAGLRRPLPKDQAILVYPNPFSSELRIDSSSPIRSVLLRNVSGAALDTIAAHGDESLTIDLSGVPVGFYILEIQTLRGIFIQKLVK